jgi:hypothetical protein
MTNNTAQQEKNQHRALFNQIQAQQKGFNPLLNIDIRGLN